MTEATAGAAQSGHRERPGYRARVERIFDHSADTRSLFLRMAEGTLPGYLPGMFISVSIPLTSETRVRPYTIASSPEDGEPFEIVFNRVPNGTGVAWMFDRRIGDVVNFTGPFGAFTLDRIPERAVVFIAEGTSIAPIRPMIRRALAQPPAHPLHFLYGADSADHILYRREIEGLAATHAQFHFETIVAAAGRDSLDAQMLEQTARRWVKADDDRSRHFYVCGIGPVVLRIRDLLRGAGYERRAVRYESW